MGVEAYAREREKELRLKICQGEGPEATEVLRSVAVRKPAFYQRLLLMFPFAKKQ